MIGSLVTGLLFLQLQFHDTPVVIPTGFLNGEMYLNSSMILSEQPMPWVSSMGYSCPR
jgi:hypothetical protein